MIIVGDVIDIRWFGECDNFRYAAYEVTTNDEAKLEFYTNKISPIHFTRKITIKLERIPIYLCNNIEAKFSIDAMKMDEPVILGLDKYYIQNVQQDNMNGTTEVDLLRVGRLQEWTNIKTPSIESSSE